VLRDADRGKTRSVIVNLLACGGLYIYSGLRPGMFGEYLAVASIDEKSCLGSNLMLYEVSGIYSSQFAMHETHVLELYVHKRCHRDQKLLGQCWLLMGVSTVNSD
jgi:hypothetical protein